MYEERSGMSNPFSPTTLRSQQLTPIQALTAAMAAMKMMKLFALMLAMMTMAISAVSAANAPAPAPGPASDATTVFVPTAIASLTALAVAFLF
ncbi:hypothetical protein L2E82_34837 [Cichorium intybus]|uniref:Uncharacterized protein n=1 Tax=Cichorium intybus TaxID=13427 RepID=A0ACB9BMU5_CICIN|nr:hypothetical protein L2E82_34837 [Cichorium intybus]